MKDKLDLLAKIRSIGLALNACHNTVTTDIPGVEPSDTAWVIDNSKEIDMVDEIEKQLNTGICPLCGDCNTPL